MAAPNLPTLGVHPNSTSAASALPVYKPIILWWYTVIKKAPFNVDQSANPITASAMDVKTEKYTQLIDTRDRIHCDYSRAPLCIKIYRGER